MYSNINIISIYLSEKIEIFQLFSEIKSDRKLEFPKIIYNFDSDQIKI